MPSGFLFVPLLSKGSAQILMRFGEFGCKTDGFSKFMYRLRKTAFCCQHAAEPIMCFSKIGLDLNGFAKVVDRFIKKALNDQGRAEIKMDHALVRRENQ